MAPTVFNLEISRSGSYVPHCILNWVISKMDWVKIWYWDFEQLTSSKLSQGYYSFYAFHSFDSFTIVNSQITSTWRLAMQVVQLYEIAKMKRYLKNHWPILNKRWQKKKRSNNLTAIFFRVKKWTWLLLSFHNETKTQLSNCLIYLEYTARPPTPHTWT